MKIGMWVVYGVCITMAYVCTSNTSHLGMKTGAKVSNLTLTLTQLRHLWPYLSYNTCYRLNVGVQPRVFGVAESNEPIIYPLWRHPDVLTSPLVTSWPTLALMSIPQLLFILSSQSWCLPYGFWGHWIEWNHYISSVTSSWRSDVI